MLTVCLQCDKTFGCRNDSCPHCGCHNFYEDRETQVLAVQALTEDLNRQDNEEKKEKLHEFNRLRFQQNPPWWMKALLWLREKFA